MNEQPTHTEQNTTPLKKDHKAVKIFMLVILLLLVAGGVGYAVYAWQQNEVANLRSEKNALEAQNAALTEKDQEEQNEAENEKSDDEKVISAFNSYCAALAVPQNAKLNPFIGTVTEEQVKIAYSTDSTFAAVNANCFARSDSQQQGGSLYILKKANEEWLVIVQTQQRPTDELIEQYAIPEDFLATLGFSQ